MKRLLCFALIISCSRSHPGSSSDAPGTPPGDALARHAPNIVFVLTDDLDVGVFNQMPRLKTLMTDQGTSFTNHFLNISLCCPSRTAILRGQYAHNTKIFSNGPPNGGFETFYKNGSEAQTLPVWLSAAGYRTVLMGKYLNGYPNTAPMNYVPAGWSEFYSPVAGDPYSEYNYTLNENGTVTPAHGATPEDYMVDVIAGKAVDFIQRASSDHVPFFMYIAPYNPHAPATPAPRYENDFPGAQAPRTPSFNEADVSDKPAWLAAHPLLTDKEIAAIDKLYRKRLQAMEAVEDLVQNLVDTLTKTGELDNTYIVFTSDNGFHQGQHRLNSGKNTAFDEDLLVPLVIRGPDVAAGATVDEPTLNVDFAPTFLDYAGVAIPPSVDGRSLRPLLGIMPPPSWRDVVFLEHAADVPDDEGALLARKSVASTLEPDDFTPDEATGKAVESGPPFEGVRTSKYTYIAYDTNEKELYDHAADPDQLTNIAVGASPALLAQLSALVGGMHGCQGDACRSAEEAGTP